MSSNKKISDAVIKRLPRYFRYLRDLLQAKITRISSTELSKRMNVTASQIRQDLNCFGGFGQQGYGYNVEMLHAEMSNILGVNEVFNFIIIGAGNMGRALANYQNFERRGFKMLGIFDANENVIGQVINGVAVKDYYLLNEEYVRANNIDIVMLCVPYDKTPTVAEHAAKIGIKGLWNFSPMDLKLSYDVIIENVHLSDSLMVLGYKLKEKFKN
jgi:redox-sensing transcriptional repressor